MDAFIEGNDMVLVLECCEKGDLAGVLKEHKDEGKRPDEQQIWKWFLQVTRCPSTSSLESRGAHLIESCTGSRLGSAPNQKQIVPHRKCVQCVTDSLRI